ncbi:hypothetical protein CY652_04935 [Burkholderia sp. WAC0059]|uniref:ankyrin repeat domain-containing protein n=1 Tax=Burkholderia sp. WAC0059 TaxID=2066022 RepID=UPI000C7F09FD|nr:ankyrin repeat domain-containing protein [Burkholderia sp. WAC0059]PLZ03727.1 hypothetical protein CY652_04935 [Burkholderia sp. WAC0059]
MSSIPAFGIVFPTRFASPLRRALAVAATLACAAGALLGAAPAHAASLDSYVKAVTFDDDSAVRKDLAAGMDPNAVDEHGTPVLVLAARDKSDKVAALLIADPKINLEAGDSAGETALMFAALNGDLTLAQLLVDKGAEVNRKGWTPLHYAATNGHDDVARLLIDHSAYVDAGSPNGTTPLMMAARGDHLSTIRLLLDHGADLNAKNQIGLTALDFAKQYKAPDAIKDLTARTQQAPAGTEAQ